MKAKAAIRIEYKIAKDGRYHQDAPEVVIEKGDLIPPGVVERILRGNPEAVVEGLVKEKRKAMIDASIPDLSKLSKAEQKKILEKKSPHKKEDLIKLNKAEQVEMLEKLGLGGSEIKKLKLEKQRVDKILELSEE